MAKIEKTVEINVDSKGAVKGVNDLEKSIDGVNASLKETSGFTGSIEGVGEGAKKSTTGVGVLSKSFKSLGIAIKATGIGLVIGLLAKLGEVFMQNQKVADIFNTTFEAVSIVFNDFVNFIVNNTGGVIKFFDAIFKNPLESLKSFANAFKENIQERFDSYLDTLGYLASAVKKVFSGDFAGALDDVKSAGKESIDVLTGVNDSFDKGKEFIEKTTEAVKGYVTETVNAAKANTELAKQSELAMVLNQGLIEDYDRQAELLRQTRDDESKNIEDRIKANKKLAEVLDEQEKAMLSNASISVQRAKVELDKNKESIELQKAFQEALNEQAGIEAQITGFRSEQQTNANALLREQKDIQNELALIGKSERDIQRTELLQQYDLQKELIDRQVADETEKNNLLLEAKRVYDEQLLELNTQFDEEDLTAQTSKQAAEEALRQKTRDELLAEKEAKAEIQLATIGVAEKGIAVGKQLAGKNKAVQKALLIAENAAGIAKILVNTGVANAKAVATSPTTLGQPWVAINSISAGLGIAGSIAATAKGLSALGGGSAGSKPNMPSGGSGGAAPTPPSFNVVGASETSALGDAVASQTNEPVQAYVVSNDVTTAQSLENNIVEGATI
jgi:hypothetical protein